MSEQGPLKTDPPQKLSRVSRTASFWILLVLMSVLVVQFMRGTEEAASRLVYSEFVDQVEADNVLEVTVFDGERIEGELKNAITLDDVSVHTFQTRSPGKLDPALIADMRTRGVRIDGEAESTGWGTVLFGVLPWLLFIAFWIWIFRTMQSGGNKAFQFGRSKAKLISPDTPKVTFTDVAGADEAKQELEEIIEFLKDPPRFSRLGGRLPKGVLLVGPPGTGKTLLARAVAGEAGRPFFQMSGSDFVEMFVGVGASRVRDLFEQGKAHAPCIIFVDEIDAVGRHRGAGLGGGHDEREQTLNALLVEMDGFEANEGVILLAATNRPDVLDPALLRPGRFDRQVVVDLPDIKGREGILRVHAKKLPLGEHVDLGVIARGTPGLSGADLSNICNEAALFAARRGDDRVKMEDFEQAKDKVMLGTERRSMVLTEAERKLTAYHEAGHAVIGVKVPGLDPVHKVPIVPRGRALGLTASLPEEDRHSYTKDWLQ
ncbi:MAG: ATP-dependent zinc metalloprotease FtsH, partial [Longimicrobiales bacterium]